MDFAFVLAADNAFRCVTELVASRIDRARLQIGFCRRAVDLSFAFESHFFNANSIDVDASIDRGGQKPSKFSLRCTMFEYKKEIDASFFFASAPLISLLHSNVAFSMPFSDELGLRTHKAGNRQADK